MPKLVTRDGKLLTRGGKLVVVSDEAECHESCCDPPPPPECGGCSGSTAPSVLSVAFDMSGTVGNLEGGWESCELNPEYSCIDESCQAASGTYSAPFDSGDEDGCTWYATFPGYGDEVPCHCGPHGEAGHGTAATEVYVFVYDDSGTYKIRVRLIFGGLWYEWVKSLGTTIPDCSELFPIELGPDDSTQVGFDIFGTHHYSELCIFNTGTITIGAA